MKSQTPGKLAREFEEMMHARIRPLNREVEALLCNGGDIVIRRPDASDFAIRLSNWFRRFDISARIVEAHDYCQLRNLKRPSRVILVPLPSSLPKKVAALCESVSSLVIEPTSETTGKIVKGCGAKTICIAEPQA